MDISEISKAQMSGAEKAAALFLVLGRENATRLASFFSKEEIKKVVDAAGDLRDLSPQVIDQVVTEFGENFESNGIVASSDTLSQYFEGAGDNNSTAANAARRTNIETSQLNPVVVKMFFENEPPQISALLLQRLGDEMAVNIISNLEANLRNEIFHAYLNRSELEDDLQSEFEDDLIELIYNTELDKGNEEEIEKTASLINQFSEQTSDEVVSFFEEVDAETAASIRKSLFKFSSIVLMSKEARAVLVDGLETEDIVQALADSGEEMRESVFEVLSQRNRRVVEAELSRGATQPEDIGKAQKKFISSALKLSKEGIISLPQTD
ncbi:MAG: hypothetical protein GY742_16590 [Hyphomicrobiales bacterium]|nr:hypothetical protein [Hyphomicrobiales bacterium]